MEKNHSTLWKAWLKVAACAFFALAMACSDGGGENDIPTPTPPPAPAPDKPTGTIDFNLKGEDGSSLPTQEPINVGSEEGLELVISQKSSYTDPNGQVYTCEPKASIELDVKTDTVYAKDLKALTAISGTPGKQTESSGTNPVKKQTLQSFSIGGQDVVFELSHEIYTYTNSKQKKIEMPYISVGEAKFGKGETVESKSVSSPVTLRSLSMSRASVTDSTLYEVNAKFNLELATVNTKESQKQTLNFDVKYLAVVEHVTELTGVLEYALDQTEYNLKGGEETIVVLEQDSKFTNGAEAVYTSQPQASVSLKAEKAQVFVGSVDELKSLIDTEDAKTSQEGSNPITHSYQKKYATKNQSFEFATSYQVCFTNETGEEMPYLKVNEPELIGIEATAKGSRASMNDTTYYDVKATFSVELEGVNVSEEHKQTLTFTVNYEGAVMETIPLTPSLTYTLEQTEYTLNGGEEKEIIITQASQFKNGDQAVFSHEPVAVIKLIVGQETVYADNVEALKTLIESEDAQVSTTGTNPKKHSYQKSLATDGQLFDFSASYEVYKASSGDEMPYLKVGEPKLLSIETVERASRASVSDTVFYDVKAKFSVDVEGVNVDTPIQKTINFETTYVGGVVSKVEGPVELVSTSYRKDMIYMPPKGNLPARAACVVYRDRKYSDNSVQTDSIYGGNWFMLEYTVYVDNSYFKETEGVSFGEYVVLEDNKSGVSKVSFSAEVPDLEQVKTELTEINLNTNKPGGYSTYSSEDDNIAFESSNPVEGWYVLPVNNIRYLHIFYSDNNRLFECCLNARYYDRFLYIDGRIIDFAEYRPSWDDGIFSSKNIDGGIVYTLECKGSYVGQEVHLKTEVTVTEKK